MGGMARSLTGISGRPVIRFRWSIWCLDRAAFRVSDCSTEFHLTNGRFPIDLWAIYGP